MAKDNNKPKIDNSMFAKALKNSPAAPVQKTVVVEEAQTIVKAEPEVLQSMYFKIDKRLKKDLTVYLAEQDMYIQAYLHDLIKRDLEAKHALKSF